MVDGGDAWTDIVAGWPWLTVDHVEAVRRWFEAGTDSGQQ